MDLTLDLLFSFENFYVSTNSSEWMSATTGTLQITHTVSDNIKLTGRPQMEPLNLTIKSRIKT